DNPGGTAETIIGNWLSKTSVPRDDLIIATKVRGQMGTDPNNQGLNKSHIMQAVEDSLRRLQIDTIDLYQTHWPDEDISIDETLAAMDTLVQQGKVRYIGCSNYTSRSLIEALLSSKKNNTVQFHSLQPHYSLVNRTEYESSLSSVCKKYKLGVLPYSPLGGGFLTGKYHANKPLPNSVRANKAQNYMSEKNFQLIRTLETIAQLRNKSISQIALRWLLSHHEVTAPIIGPRTITQLHDNLGAVEFQLTEPELEKIDKASK
ncbi:MAG TPA: aldo/keto reductase, partial [Chloroflexi bacterium]|nr:aldo/keto reductase [Chloroflexota bacterium]